MTVTSPEDAKKIRDMEKKSDTDNYFQSSSDSLSKEEIQVLADHADVITACASKWTREIAGKKALIQMGASVPMFALTPKGKKLLFKKAEKLQKQLILHTATLPSLVKEQPEPLV